MQLAPCLLKLTTVVAIARHPTGSSLAVCATVFVCVCVCGVRDPAPCPLPTRSSWPWRMLPCTCAASVTAQRWRAVAGGKLAGHGPSRRVVARRVGMRSLGAARRPAAHQGRFPVMGTMRPESEAQGFRRCAHGPHCEPRQGKRAMRRSRCPNSSHGFRLWAVAPL